jgi:hypothetical protein
MEISCSITAPIFLRNYPFDTGAQVILEGKFWRRLSSAVAASALLIPLIVASAIPATASPIITQPGRIKFCNHLERGGLVTLQIKTNERQYLYENNGGEYCNDLRGFTSVVLLTVFDGEYVGDDEARIGIPYAANLAYTGIGMTVESTSPAGADDARTRRANSSRSPSRSCTGAAIKPAMPTILEHDHAPRN